MQLLKPFFRLGCWILAISSIGLATEKPSQVGQKDLVLLLPNGPMHVRLKVTQGDASLEQLRGAYVDRLIEKLDVNQDGQLTNDETRNHALFMTGKRFSDTALAKSLPSAKNLNRSYIEQSVERAIGQSMVFRQIASVAEQDLQVFKVLDEDQSGLIERHEMRTSAARLAAKDLDHDYCVTFDEFTSTGSGAMMPEIALQMIPSEPPPPVHSEMLRDAREPVMASRLIRTYDLDKDAKLSAKELQWDSERVAALDQNRDGFLTVGELAKISDMEPDVSIAIELTAGKDAGYPEVEKGSKTDKVVLVSSRSTAHVKMLSGGMIEIKQPTTTITLGYRDRDPVEEALKNARDTFNAIDQDANGYLDREEIVTHPRFQRYLFDAMDVDRDDRVFSKEMEEYVRGFAEPSATVCQVTLFDSGNGYFQMLDRNGDGRISIRELRGAEANLLASASGDSPELNPSQMARYFKIEIQRGGPTPFGPTTRPRAELPQAAMRNNGGPIWFQRMDRNGDGDLVWDEFLGPRDVFTKLDQDNDGLLDADEAISSTAQAVR
jgi:Ca2+-binding EF-hand superfamily protein